jgi:hypothetical protein
MEGKFQGDESTGRTRSDMALNYDILPQVVEPMLASLVTQERSKQIPNTITIKQSRLHANPD